MSRRPRILIAKAGTAAPEIVSAHGDYDRWFIDAMGDADRFRVVEIYRDEPLPSPSAFDGVIVTGSPLSVCAPTPWMEAAGSTLREWSEAGRAVLGVCFGLQLMAHSFGRPVIKNPNGREIGTISVDLNNVGKQDILFEGLAPTLRVQSTHTDVASEVPTGTRLLAGNATAPIQTLWFGPKARGVQFHPELRAAAMRTLVHSRKEILARENLDGDRIEAEIEETPVGEEILRRFEERLAG